VYARRVAVDVGIEVDDAGARIEQELLRRDSNHLLGRAYEIVVAAIPVFGGIQLRVADKRHCNLIAVWLFKEVRMPARDDQRPKRRTRKRGRSALSERTGQVGLCDVIGLPEAHDSGGYESRREADPEIANLDGRLPLLGTFMNLNDHIIGERLPLLDVDQVAQAARADTEPHFDGLAGRARNRGALLLPEIPHRLALDDGVDGIGHSLDQGVSGIAAYVDQPEVVLPISNRSPPETGPLQGLHYLLCAGKIANVGKVGQKADRVASHGR
jgi:hypothetical protein